MKNVSDKFCRKNQNTYFVSKKSFVVSWRLWDNVEKHCRAGQDADDNEMRRMRIPAGYLKPQIHIQNM